MKYHFKSNQGVKSMSSEQAERLTGLDADFYLRDLSENITAGNFPKWDLHVQVMPYEDAKTYRFNPFDLSKVWPHGDYPLIKVGTMELNRNPENFFAQIEQAAFSPANLVPGIGASPGTSSTTTARTAPAATTSTILQFRCTHPTPSAARRPSSRRTRREAGRMTAN